MTNPQHLSQPARTSSTDVPTPWKSLALPLMFLTVLSTAGGFTFARFADLAANPESTSVAHSSSLSSRNQSPEATKTDLEDISSLPPQQQAERLLQSAIQHRSDSLDLIHRDVDSWRGHLQNTGPLFDLVLKALISEDIRVRTAAIEIDLAANNLDKSPKSIAQLVRTIRRDPVERPFALWRLGALGNRGVEPQTVLADLVSYAHDVNEDTRYWAVQGLAMLGSQDAIDPLINSFAHDASPRVRQRAGLSLALSGMLTPEQRLAAVPDLLNLLDDDSIDHTTRGWVYGALHLITGTTLPNTAQAWQSWWAHHDDHPHHSTVPDSFSRA